MKLVIFGMLIGIANIIPGVSGGTMAVILNVYDKLINAISTFYKNFAASMKILVPIGIGALLGIFLFSAVINYCLENFNVATNMIFIGLVVGSIPLIYKKTEFKKLEPSYIISFLTTFIVVLGMEFLSPENNQDIIEVLNVSAFFKLFLCSMIAAGAMIIPGISGSMLLLLFGIYDSISSAIENLNILILMPVGLGVVVGILGCAKIIEKLFLKYEKQTYFSILGLMCGSIFAIFPQFSFNLEFFVGIILFLGVTFATYKYS